MKILGVRLLGFDIHTLHKIILTVGFLIITITLRYLLVRLTKIVTQKHRNEQLVFWTRQISNLTTAFLMFLAIMSIWFDNPGRLATGFGLFTAGLAFALQKVVTAFAGYVVIIRGKTFSVGDRITMGGVRGDVISLGFIQTRIMEMGQPPAVQGADPAMWVRGRQYTGRIVTVTNDTIFNEPVYNYTRDFPFVWDEIKIPISYDTDRNLAEEILLRCAHKYTDRIREESLPKRKMLEETFFIDVSELDPKVFYNLTDNWLELNLRFIVHERGVREVKNLISRSILDEFKAAAIGIASGTYDIVGFPPLKIDPLSLDNIVAAIRSGFRGSRDDRLQSESAEEGPHLH